MDCEAFREDMMDALYGEGGAAASRRFGAHVAACGRCRQEMAQLRRLRGDLAQWRLPDGMGTPSAPAAALWRRLPLPLAAAAALLVATGAALALSGTEVRHDRSGFSVRLGGGGPDVQALLAAQEQRHRTEIEGLRAQIAILRPHEDDALLRTVSRMIGESEARRDASWEQTLRRLRERSEAHRQYDLARMSAGLAYVDGKAGLQAARTTELVGHVLQASQKK